MDSLPPPPYNSTAQKVLTLSDIEKYRVKSKYELLLPVIDDNLKRVIKTQPLSSHILVISPDKKYFYNSVSCCKNLWCCVDYTTNDCFCCYCNECFFCSKRSEDNLCSCPSCILCCVPYMFDCYNYIKDPSKKSCASSTYISKKMIECFQDDCCCSCCYWKLNWHDMTAMNEFLQKNYENVFKITINPVSNVININLLK